MGAQIQSGLSLGQILLLVLAAIAGAGVVLAFQKPDVIDTALGCVETVATKASAPTGDSMADGGEIQFRDDIAPGHWALDQQIRGVYVGPGAFPTTAEGIRSACVSSCPAERRRRRNWSL